MEFDPHHWITKFWYVRGDYELGTVRGLSRLLRKASVCFDVGANAGFFTLQMARLVGERGVVHSFEPTMSTFQRLTRNVALNHFENVVCQNLALGSSMGVMEFLTGPAGYDVYNSATAVVHPDAVNVPFQKTIVSVCSLDEYCENHGIQRVDCVKIDVEGGEMEVLRGMRRVLETNANIVLLTEFSQLTAAGSGSSVESMAEYLTAMGFNLYVTDQSGRHFPVGRHIPKLGEMVWAARATLAGLG